MDLADDDAANDPVNGPANDPGDQAFIEVAKNALNVCPEIDSPYTRPPRKNTNFPNFPPGFSPFDDARDPGADPDAYPPPTRSHFGEFIGQVQGGSHPLIQRYITPSWARITTIPTIPKVIAMSFGALVSPVYFYVKMVDIWRHYNGWLYYLFYYVLGTQGYVLRTKECVRVLREGPSRRFTVTEQFWFRRGCEGGSDGLVAHGQLTKNVNVLALVFDTKFANKSRFLTESLVLLWALSSPCHVVFCMPLS